MRRSEVIKGKDLLEDIEILEKSLAKVLSNIKSEPTLSYLNSRLDGHDDPIEIPKQTYHQVLSVVYQGLLDELRSKNLLLESLNETKYTFGDLYNNMTPWGGLGNMMRQSLRDVKSHLEYYDEFTSKWEEIDMNFDIFEDDHIYRLSRAEYLISIARGNHD